MMIYKLFIKLLINLVVVKNEAMRATNYLSSCKNIGAIYWNQGDYDTTSYYLR